MNFWPTYLFLFCFFNCLFSQSISNSQSESEDVDKWLNLPSHDGSAPGQNLNSENVIEDTATSKDVHDANNTVSSKTKKRKRHESQGPKAKIPLERVCI